MNRLSNLQSLLLGTPPEDWEQYVAQRSAVARIDALEEKWSEQLKATYRTELAEASIRMDKLIDREGVQILSENEIPDHGANPEVDEDNG